MESQAVESALTMEIHNVDLFADDEEDDGTSAPSVSRRRTSQLLPSTSERLKERQARIRNCKISLEKMPKTWKVPGKESANNRAQLFVS